MTDVLDNKVQNLVNAQSNSRQSLVEQLLALIIPYWKNFTGWYDDDLVTANAARCASQVELALAHERRFTRAYLETYFKLLGDMEKLTVPPTPAEMIYPRIDTSSLDVYSRPAEQYRYALSQGVSPEDAVDVAVKRVTDTATMDVQLARRDEARNVMLAHPKVIGFRRVIHPELSKSGTCGMCIAAATRFYTREDMEPIHAYCKCEVLPVTAENDPGKTMNEKDLRSMLDSLYKDAGGNTIDDLTNTRYKLDKNGELGKVLTPESAGSSAVKKAVNKAEPKPFDLDYQVGALQKSLAALKERKANGEQKLDAPIKWQTDRIATLKKQLASK